MYGVRGHSIEASGRTHDVDRMTRCRDIMAIWNFHKVLSRSVGRWSVVARTVVVGRQYSYWCHNIILPLRYTRNVACEEQISPHDVSNVKHGRQSMHASIEENVTGVDELGAAGGIKLRLAAVCRMEWVLTEVRHHSQC